MRAARTNDNSHFPRAVFGRSFTVRDYLDVEVDRRMEGQAIDSCKENDSGAVNRVQV